MSSLTPLGKVLSVARVIDELEDQAKGLLQGPEDEKERLRLEEMLTKAQLELDGIYADESAKPVKKAQTSRVLGLLKQLEAK